MAAIVGCSDDGSGPRADTRAAELGADVGAVLDGGADSVVADQGAADVVSDAGPIADGAPDGAGADAPGADGATVDAAADGGPADGGSADAAASTAPVWGFVSRTVTPVLDGKGALYVGLYLPDQPPPAFQLGGAQIASADLSASGAQLKYEIYNVQPGSYVLYAFLDDNNNTFPLLPGADPGDLVVSAPVSITVTTSPQRKDLVLDAVEGVASGDGGVSDAYANLGSIKGVVKSTASAVGDAQGTVYVALHDALPPAGQLLITPLNGADLSSPFASEAYFLGGIPAGNYYLRVFLDDNNNVNPFGPAPDTGDLVHTQPIQVHVFGGTINVRDVVLDGVL